MDFLFVSFFRPAGNGEPDREGGGGRTGCGEGAGGLAGGGPAGLGGWGDFTCIGGVKLMLSGGSGVTDAGGREGGGGATTP